MIKKSPLEFDLSSIDLIRIKSGEDALFSMDFEEDMSGATHTVIIEEVEWQYQPYAYDTLTAVERSTFDTSDEANGIITHSIDADTIASWEGKRLSLHWKVELNGRTWVAASRTFLVEEI